MAEQIVTIHDEDGTQLGEQLSFFVETAAHREAKKLSRTYTRKCYVTVACSDGVGGTKVTAYAMGKLYKPK